MNTGRLFALITGALFGAGLNIGGMTNPARVRGFLDIFGDWDPTLGRGRVCYGACVAPSGANGQANVRC